MKLLANPNKKEQFIEQINSFLPSDIRALTMTRVSKGFNSKQHCTKRRYHYLLPTYALMAETDMNAVLKMQFDKQGPVPNAGRGGGYVEENTKRSVGPAGLQEAYGQVKTHRSTAATVTALREALKSYEGTRAYHNFTTGKHPDDANAKRFIISFDCGEPFVDEATGVEWVLLTVLGQSFLLNQIRKMVGMAVEVARGAATMSNIKDAFTSRKMDLPMAPALGLYLGELFFDGYNNKQRKEMINDKRLAALKAERAAKVWPPPSSSASSAPAPAAVAAEPVAADQECDEAASKKARLNPAADNNNESTAAPVSLVTATAASSSTSTNTSTNTSAAASAPAPAAKGGAKSAEKEDEGQCHEEITWSTDPATVAATTAFREQVIHKHIFQQDGKTLDFLYYFDYLRAYPHQYDDMTKAFAPVVK